MYSGGWLHVRVCVWQCGFPIGGKKQEVISVSNLQKVILLNTNLMYCMDTTEVLNTGRTFLRGTGTVSVHQAVLVWLPALPLAQEKLWSVETLNIVPPLLNSFPRRSNLSIIWYVVSKRRLFPSSYNMQHVVDTLTAHLACCGCYLCHYSLYTVECNLIRPACSLLVFAVYISACSLAVNVFVCPGGR